MTDVTQILRKIEQGDPEAADQLLPLVYHELRKLAFAKLSNENPGQTLQATALVHEAFVRLVDVNQPQCWNGRGHFFGAAAEAMRRILIENARRKGQSRRGGGRRRVSLDELDVAARDPAANLLELDEALGRLEQRDARAAEVVKLRYFVGLNNPEIAEALCISVRSVERDWTYAKTWLYSALTEGDADGST